MARNVRRPATEGPFRAAVVLAGALCFFLVSPQVSYGTITGTLYDGSPTPGFGYLMVVGLKTGFMEEDFRLLVPDCYDDNLGGSYPDYTFSLDCDPDTTYGIAVLPLGEEGGPLFVAGMIHGVAWDSAGVADSLLANADAISGHVTEKFSQPMGSEVEIYALDQAGLMRAIAFMDTLGDYRFDFLPAGIDTYDIVAAGYNHYPAIVTQVVTPSSGNDFDLERCGASGITASSGTGFDPDPEDLDRVRWVLSDATDFSLTITVYNAASLGEGRPLNWVMIEAPCEFMPWALKYTLSRDPLDYEIDPSLDWTGITIDTTHQADRVIFSQGSGTATVPTSGSADFVVTVSSMTNVASDWGGGWDVLGSHNGGVVSGMMDYEAGLEDSLGYTETDQKVLRISDIVFVPEELNDSTAAPGAHADTIYAVVENHGTATVELYPPWCGLWSDGAFANMPMLAAADTIPAAGVGAIVWLDVDITMGIGDYTVTAQAADSVHVWGGSWTDYGEPLEVMAVGVEDGSEPTRTECVAFALGQSSPNPSRGPALIGYAVPGLVSRGSGGSREARVSLKVYNTQGQLVRTLVDEVLSAGRYVARWDGCGARGRRVASGVYFYRLEIENEQATRKLILLR